MRVYFLLIVIFLMGACSKKTNFYKGYVYYKNKPLPNVTVKKQNENNQKNTITDSTGFFKLTKDPNSITPLIFLKKGFVTDTIPSVWIQHGEKVYYTFLNESFDTIFLKKTLPNKNIQQP